MQIAQPTRGSRALFRLAGFGAWVDVACTVGGILLLLRLAPAEAILPVNLVQAVGTLLLLPLPLALARCDPRNGGAVLALGLTANLLVVITAALAAATPLPVTVAPLLQDTGMGLFGAWLLIANRPGTMPGVLVRLGRWGGAMFLIMGVLSVGLILGAILQPEPDVGAPAADVASNSADATADPRNIGLLALAVAPEMVWEVFIGGYLLALADLPDAPADASKRRR
ncbi:MAG: hypothetical protein QOF51_3436 [Chloroflexota bacterium]|nr:hypothetical protein [Chloroflexota bacterium]